MSGAGLDTSTADYTNILARAVQVNAGIWANTLNVVTGVNQAPLLPALVVLLLGLGATMLAWRREGR